MKVEHHLLHRDDGAPIPFIASPNHARELVAPAVIVLHYTAGRSFEQSCKWLCDPAAKASAHIVIGRGGSIAQLVPFDQRAWHAGESSLVLGGARGYAHVPMHGLNQFSIGIELDNAGLLHRTAVGWVTAWGAKVGGDDVVIAEHKHGGGVRGWHAYTSDQIEACEEVCRALMAAYPSIVEVVGHDDIAPKRKLDPGPALNLESFRSRLFGRNDE